MNEPEIIALCRQAPVECWSTAHRSFLVRREETLLLAKHVLGSFRAAKHWMTEPAFGLGHQLPCSLISTREGYMQVRNLLRRIEYGVYT